MLTKKQVSEIKEHLEKAQNPIFFFDNDVDGLCSFLLLQRYIGRGKGIPIKSFPELDPDYFRKVNELNGDYIFILDKPVVSKSFFENVNEFNFPVVWIDHHEIDREQIPDFVNYYNPLFNRKKSNEPVTALCYQIVKNKADLWIALVGCISDKFIPSFYSKFRRKFPNLSAVKSPKDAFDIYYNSDIGKIARILNFALKDRTTNVISMLKFMMKSRTPMEVLEETNQNFLMHLRFKQINSKYQKFLQKAKAVGLESGKVLFFQFGGEISISSDLSNELSYRFPGKVIVVIYVKGTYSNISMRGENVRKIVLEAIDGLKDATGGGHENAVGAKIRVDDLDIFKERVEKLVEKN